MKKVIETERLILRPFTLDDAEGSWRLSQDEEVMKFLGGIDKGTVEEHREMLKKAPIGDYEKYGFGRFAMIDKITQEYVGFTGLKYIEELDEVDLGYRISSKYWRKGYSYEAALPSLDFGFNDLGLERIIALANPDNVASTGLMKKLGFVYEKDIRIYDEDAVYYALNKSDWIKNN